jgi:hypothetical protein
MTLRYLNKDTSIADLRDTLELLRSDAQDLAQPEAHHCARHGDAESRVRFMFYEGQAAIIGGLLWVLGNEPGDAGIDNPAISIREIEQGEEPD